MRQVESQNGVLCCLDLSASERQGGKEKVLDLFSKVGAKILL